MRLDDGRYLDRRGDAQRIVVIETEGALPPARRKRRRPRKARVAERSVTLPLTVVTVVMASEPLEDEAAAAAWLEAAAAEEATDALLEDGLATLDRALAAGAATTGRVLGEPVGLDLVVNAKIGYGEGGQVYDGRFIDAIEIDARGGTAAPRRQRLERIVPLARIAAILGGREPLLACEVLVPRVRADLDAGRVDAAALTVHEAVRSTLIELELRVEGPEHESDLDHLERLLPGLAALPAQVFDSDPAVARDPAVAERAGEALEVAERVIRRFRITTQ